MLERQPMRVERRTIEALIDRPGTPSTIGLISHERMTLVREVNTDLMRPTGFESNAKACGILVQLFDGIVRNRALSFLHFRAEALAIGWMAAVERVDRPALVLGDTHRHRDVFLENLARLKEGRERVLHGLVLR